MPELIRERTAVDGAKGGIGECLKHTSVIDINSFINFPVSQTHQLQCLGPTGKKEAKGVVDYQMFYTLAKWFE